MKFIAKRKNNRLNVKVKFTQHNIIDPEELDFVSRVYIRGFLKPVVFKKNYIEYTGSIGISLVKRLKKPISKYEFFFIMEQIVVAAKRLSNSNLHANRMIFDARGVFVNEVTKELQFLYVPFNVGSDNPDILTFMKSIIYLMKPVECQDDDYISRFMYFISSLNSYDMNKIERYIEREDNRIVKILKPHAIQIHSEDNVGKGGDFAALREDDKTDLIHEDSTHLLNESDHSETNSDSPTVLLPEDDTSLLKTDDDNTELLFGEDDTELLHYPSIERISTGEVIKICKTVFRLGKESGCADYVVTDNTTVSGSHADIITRNQKFFVIDLNSKNGTYINNRVLPAQYEMEIFDGDRLKLSNEEFVFRV